MNIALAHIAVDAKKQPSMWEVLQMIREAQTKVMVLSNSRDHSSMRWSDILQSLLREHGSEGDDHSTSALMLTRIQRGRGRGWDLPNESVARWPPFSP